MELNFRKERIVLKKMSKDDWLKQLGCATAKAGRSDPQCKFENYVLICVIFSNLKLFFVNPI